MHNQQDPIRMLRVRHCIKPSWRQFGSMKDETTRSYLGAYRNGRIVCETGITDMGTGAHAVLPDCISELEVA